MPVTVSTVEASNPRGLTAAAGRIGAEIGELDAVITTEREALSRLRAAWPEPRRRCLLSEWPEGPHRPRAPVHG